MDTTRSEGSLQDEIHFLTKLIQSHHAAPSSSLPKQSKNKFTGRAFNSNSRAKPKARNMVYRPPKVEPTSPPLATPSSSTGGGQPVGRQQARPGVLPPSSKKKRKPRPRRKRNLQLKWERSSAPTPQPSKPSAPSPPTDGHTTAPPANLKVAPAMPLTSHTSAPPVHPPVTDTTSNPPPTQVGTPSNPPPTRPASKSSLKKARKKSTSKYRWRRPSKGNPSPGDLRRLIPITHSPHLPPSDLKRRLATPTYTSTPCKINAHHSGSMKKRKKKGSQALGKKHKPQFKNKVWVPPTEVIFISPPQLSISQDSPDKDKPAGPVMLVGHEKKTKQGNKQWVVAGGGPVVLGNPKPPPLVGGPVAPSNPVVRPLRLVGHEKKTKQGNRQWVVARTPVRPVRPRLIGHEKKTKRGNKQWVVAGLTPVRRLSRRRTPKSRQRGSVVAINGGRYTMDSSGKRLKRLSTSSLTCLSPAISGYLGGGAMNTSVKRIMASRVVKRSKAYVWHARMKKQQDRSKQFCLFFNRFGKCNKGKDCPYIHDPDKIAICTKFLRGTCDKVNGTCPFSHKISKEKMPVCSFFLRGVCTRDACPYLHVSVGRDAKVCPDFLKGYCPRGEKCTMQHTLDCPKFFLTGSCPDGSKCPLRHSKKPKVLLPVAMVKEPRAFKKVRHKQEQMAGPLLLEEGGGGSGGDEWEDHAPLVTGKELEFIPLELNAGSYVYINGITLGLGMGGHS